MKSPYLWDQSGAPDPFAAKLERALSAKREKVKAIGRRKLRVLRIVGVASIATAAAAALVLWCGPWNSSGAPSTSPASVGTPPVAVETDAAAEVETPRVVADSQATSSTDPSKPRSASEDPATALDAAATSSTPAMTR